MANQKERYIEEIMELLEKCNGETLERVFELNRVLVGLTAAQMEYLLELSNLLFCKPFE